MIYKSYLVEQNIDLLNNNLVLFYGENLGLKNDLKKTIKSLNKKAFIKSLNQEEILANIDKFINELFNNSLFEETKMFFIDQTSDKILELIKEIEKKEDTPKIFLFSELLDKKSKLRNYFEKSKMLGIVPCYADNEISLKNELTNSFASFLFPCGILLRESIKLIVPVCK